MTSLRTRIELNKGRLGIPLDKLANISKVAERLLENICGDLEIKDPLGRWLACNFENGSLSFDVEYHGQVSELQIEKCRSSLNYIAKGQFTPDHADFGISRETLLQYIKISDYIDADEIVRIGLYTDDEKRPAEENWHNIHKQQFVELKESMFCTIDCYGSIQARIRTLQKDSNYVVVRDIVTQRLIKCYFEPDQYTSILALLDPKDTIVHIAGMMKISRVDHRIEKMDIERVKPASSYKRGDLDRFAGCAPKLTGKLSTRAFIDKVRDYGE